jgi:nucleotide-binding universal stress UspA family protein
VEAVNILLAVDGSDPSDVAVREVASRPWPQPSTVRILYVEPMPMLAGAVYAPPPMAMGSASLPAAVIEAEREATERAAANVAKHAEELKAVGLATEFRRRRGDPRSEILDEAKEWPADLIVVGSHGHTGFKRWLLGSVAQAVVSHAPCSVEVVRRESPPE